MFQKICDIAFDIIKPVAVKVLETDVLPTELRTHDGEISPCLSAYAIKDCFVPPLTLCHNGGDVMFALFAFAFANATPAHIELRYFVSL